MRIRKSILKRIITEVAGGTITLDTKEEVMAAIQGQDIEIVMGGMGPAIIVQGGPTYMVNNAFEPMMAAYDYDGSALMRGLEAVARSVHVDEDLKEELGIFEEGRSNEGTKLEDMSDSWRQILGDILKDK